MYDLFCDIEGAQRQKMIFPQDPKANWISREPKRSLYTELIQRTAMQYEKYRNDAKWGDVVGARDAKIMDLSRTIVKLRQEDSHRWMAAELGRQGFTNVVQHSLPSEVPGGPEWKKVDLAATLNAYTDEKGRLTADFKAIFKNRKAFQAWITENGDIDGSKAQGDSSSTHNKVLKAWKVASRGQC
ncbi:hypothetical protein G6O67_007216 [Ophiocordyceps sinensis]|uniref:Uncharacterized protein n=1 Tax=Ophiocordyceps sinensis TaxID=72228 RepID=A0A8H4LUQ5_9HYPO|nr:hypothetical protein G6O67_007216 [Ophiocordyceps sinensis]